MPHIDLLSQDNQKDLEKLIQDLRLDKDSQYIERCLALGTNKKNGEAIERETLLGYIDQQIAGFCILNFKPAYPPFIKFNIPELQDLNTHPDFRQRGVATALIQKCELLAKQHGAQSLGLGVGLHTGYGKAHRLYVKMGFIPDGEGVVYDTQIIQPHDIRSIDDDLCLMMTKDL